MIFEKLPCRKDTTPRRQITRKADFAESFACVKVGS